MSNKMGTLKLSDVANIPAFKKWVDMSLGDFYLGDSIKEAHLEKYIEYIRDEIMSSDMDHDEKRTWMKSIRSLERIFTAKGRGNK